MIDVDYKAKIRLTKLNPNQLNGEQFERNKKKLTCL